MDQAGPPGRTRQQGGSLLGVSCAAAHACTAVGQYSNLAERKWRMLGGQHGPHGLLGGHSTGKCLDGCELTTSASSAWKSDYFFVSDW